MKQIYDAEVAIAGKDGSKVTHKVLDTVNKDHKSFEQVQYIELMERMIEENQANAAYQPKTDAENEFTKPIESIKYLFEDL